MSTVDRALKLLRLFTATRPEIGLSELARLAGYDKATTRRFLVALQKHAFVEQDQSSRKYRLGAAVLHLAQVREATRPLASVVAPLLEALSAATVETCYASHFTAGTLVTIGYCQANRATQVTMDPAEILPLHATGSGLAFLAFGPEALADRAIEAGLTRYTAGTITSAAALRRQLDAIRRAGHAVASRSYEEEIAGIGMPFFDGSGAAVGAIGVAAPVSRMSPELEERIVAHLLVAVLAATNGIGGTPSRAFVAATTGREAA